MAGRSHFKLAPIIAHRGVPLLAPENSLAGFALAAAKGYSWVELDAQASSDKVAMVHHDTKLSMFSKLANQPSSQLTSHEIGSHEGKAQHMPTLVSCLELLVARNIGVVVEIKSSLTQSRKNTEATLAVLEGLDTGRMIVASFSKAVLAIVARERPDLPLALNTDKVPSTIPAHVNNVHFREQDAQPELITKLIERDIGVYSYTVNTVERAKMLYEMGVAGVFTDNHQLLELQRQAERGD